MHLCVLRKSSPRKIFILLQLAFTQSIKNAYTVRCEQFCHSRFIPAQKLLAQDIQEVSPSKELKGWEKSACQNLFNSAFVWLLPVDDAFSHLSACFFSQDLYLASQNHTKIYQKCIRRRVRAVLTQQIFSSPKAFLAGHIGNMSKRKDAGIGEICTSKPTWFDSRSAIRKSNIQTKRGTSFGAEQSFLHKMKQPLVFYSKISFSAPYSASRSA